jgi:hypothetical protein
MDVNPRVMARWLGRVGVSVGLSACLGVALLGACSTGGPASPRLGTEVSDDAGTDALSTEDVATAAACFDAGYPGCPSTPPSWKTQVQPLVDTACSPCHFNGGSGTGNGFDYSTSEGLRHGLTTALTDVHACVMPPSGAAPLSMADWETLLEWLGCGAPDN